MIEKPEILYHYTSLETLALILTNKTICFNTLLNVDDIEEAETSDLGLFRKYVYVSCWTDDPKESIALWQMYTPNMHGVRIQMPSYPFKKHDYKAGEYYFKEDTSSYIDLKKMYNENKACMPADLPDLIQIKYTEDESLLKPRTRYGSTSEEWCSATESKSSGEGTHYIQYKMGRLGKHKNEAWGFQKE